MKDKVEGYEDMFFLFLQMSNEEREAYRKFAAEQVMKKLEKGD